MVVRVVVALSLFLLIGCRRNQNTVAEVNGERILDTQFIERYNQYLASTSQHDNILLRQQVLNNMINETLIYRDLSRRGLDRDETYRVKMEDLSAQALLVAYARKIVTDTTNISDEELHREFRAYNSKVTARYLYAKTEEGARTLKAKVEHGVAFEELARDVFEDPGLASNGGSLGTFGWGEMEPALEGPAFSIAVGSVSDPVRMSMGYAIVKVEHRVENQFVTEADFVNVREKLWRRVLDRRFSEIIKEELQRIEKNLSPSFNGEAVSEVFKNWQIMTNENTPAPPKELAARSRRDLSNMELVRFKNGAWSVSEFVTRLAKTTERQKQRVRKPEDIKSMAIGLATRDVLLEKANRLGLAFDSTVVHNVRGGREAYLLRRWALSITDTVGASGWDEHLLHKKYEETKTERAYPPEVNVGEILLQTEQDANRIVLLLRKGSNFADLARKHSIRSWAAKQNGELGFGTEARFGSMGKKFFAAKVGEIIGPEKVDPYFGIFKVLERHEGRTMTFDEARGQVIQELTQMRQMDARKNALEQLRQGITLSINNELLANIVIN
jgi:parvulin-like peptidyl-prolyl isomerase